MAAVEALLAYPEWRNYYEAIRRYAELRAPRIVFETLPPDQTNFERGYLTAIRDLLALPELIVTKTKEIHNHGERANSGRTEHNALVRALHWGNPAFWWGRER